MDGGVHLGQRRADILARGEQTSRHQDRGELALTIKTLISPLTSCLSVTGTQACGGTSDAENLQLCDTCDRGCHVACGKLRRVPGRAGWHCSGCCAAAGKTGQAGSRLHKAGAAAAAAARQLDDDSEDDDFKPAKASAGLGWSDAGRQGGDRTDAWRG